MRGEDDGDGRGRMEEPRSSVEETALAEAPAGTVISQLPEAGARVPPGTRVDLLLSATP